MGRLRRRPRRGPTRRSATARRRAATTGPWPTWPAGCRTGSTARRRCSTASPSSHSSSDDRARIAELRDISRRLRRDSEALLLLCGADPGVHRGAPHTVPDRSRRRRGPCGRAVPGLGRPRTVRDAGRQRGRRAAAPGRRAGRRGRRGVAGGAGRGRRPAGARRRSGRRRGGDRSRLDRRAGRLPRHRRGVGGRGAARPALDRRDQAGAPADRPAGGCGRHPALPGRADHPARRQRPLVLVGRLHPPDDLGPARIGAPRPRRAAQWGRRAVRSAADIGRRRRDPDLRSRRVGVVPRRRARARDGRLGHRGRPRVAGGGRTRHPHGRPADHGQRPAAAQPGRPPGPPAPQSRPAAPPDERVPERVRDRLSTYQRGLQQGRHRAADAAPDSDGSEAWTADGW